MGKGLSIYLDELRWLAAIGVLFYHAAHMLSPTLLGMVTDQGIECVAVFFVLSGFVIRFVSLEKEKDWREYAKARMARMYSVVFLAILVTLIADRLGLLADPSIYLHHAWYNPSLTVKAMLSYPIFTSEFWFRHVIVGSDEPFWSLGFEVPYYVFFGIAIYAPRQWRTLLMALWAVVVGPKILLYLPLWLMGVFAYDTIHRGRSESYDQKWLGVALILLSAAVYLVDRYWLLPHPLISMYEWGSWKSVVLSFIYFMIVGVAVVANIIGFDHLAGAGFSWHPKLGKSIRWLAGGSFTLYLVHQPLLAAAKALFPPVRTDTVAAATAVAVIFAITLLLAEIGERRKTFYRHLFAFPTAVRQLKPSAAVPPSAGEG